MAFSSDMACSGLTVTALGGLGPEVTWQAIIETAKVTTTIIVLMLFMLRKNPAEME